MILNFLKIAALLLTLLLAACQYEPGNHEVPATNDEPALSAALEEDAVAADENSLDDLADNDDSSDLLIDGHDADPSNDNETSSAAGAKKEANEKNEANAENTEPAVFSAKLAPLQVNNGNLSEEELNRKKLLQTDFTPPGEVSAAAVSAVAMQSISLNWRNPTDEDFNLTAVYYRCSAGTTACLPAGYTLHGTTPTRHENAYLVDGLLAEKTYDILIRTVDGQPEPNQSTGIELTDIQLHPGEILDDFNSNQQVNSLNGNRVYMTWTADRFYAAVTDGAGSALLGAGQSLWIALETDQKANGRSMSIQTAEPGRCLAAGGQSGPCSLLWPFKADTVIELQQLNDGVSAVNIYTGSDGWQSAPPGMAEGGPSRLSFSAALIGNRVPGRLAYAVVDTYNGMVIDLAPASPLASDVTGYYASMTAGLLMDGHVFNLQTAPRSADLDLVPLEESAALVTLSVFKAGQPTDTLRVYANLKPFSDQALADSSAALLDDGLKSDRAAGDGIYTGRFNLGSLPSELWFKFADSQGMVEPAFQPVNRYRVYSLSGRDESLPLLEFGRSYSSDNPFSITFMFMYDGPGRPDRLLGSHPGLGSWNHAAGLESTFDGLTAVSTWNGSAVDFNLEPVFFKQGFADGSTECDHAYFLNEDVINFRTVRWKAGQCAGNDVEK